MIKSKILIVDDEPDIRQLLSEILEDEGYLVSIAESGSEARKRLNEQRPDLILLDIWMPDEDGISLLKDWLKNGYLDCPVIMMSGHATIETAVEATRLGAHDFLEKPLSMAKLLVTVERALEAARLRKENIGLKRRVEPVLEPIGKSAAMERLREQIKKLAQHDARVLLVGEPGSGKETFARYLHQMSPRREGPFIDVGVGAFAPDHSAVEFFGRESGGHIHRGLLEQAHGGSLFLDEVADMDGDTQLRLLSALESRAFSRIGGSDPINVDVRVIASTRKMLEEEVRNGVFRRDLLYQLNVVTLKIPPLREHTEDIPELLSWYVDYFVSREKIPFRRFPVAVQNFLRNYPWPGNIRELKNLVQRLMILGAGEEVSLDEVRSALGESLNVANIQGQPDFFGLPLKEARDKFEKAYLEYHLEKYSGNVARLSQAIGLERTHLYRKLNSLGVNFKDRR
ncbi:sigma-54-dependent transcriptional regulator [Methylotetracoccus oryzae]|uniref:sigma-54-dependent transcriptional regulator n=1 Tax=Methylotetracoccus oryzae TaxID=1919059 RepID=UPI0011194786|nr:sigma-54 dependent transcriptional regulator [Methylotetracoccus oryzae]